VIEYASLVTVHEVRFLAVLRMPTGAENVRSLGVDRKTDKPEHRFQRPDTTKLSPFPVFARRMLEAVTEKPY